MAMRTRRDEGGMTARVINEDDVTAVPAGAGGATARHTLDEPLFAQRVLRLPPGTAHEAAAEGDEVMFVLAGHGVLHAGGVRHALEPETAAAVPRAAGYRLEQSGDGELKVLAVTVRDPDAPSAPAPATVRLTDQDAGAATTNRSFRLLCGPGAGCASATQFVGYIPTETAPDHYHRYDEVIYVLDGEGVMHMGGEHAPLGPGSCIALPAETVHCLDNTGAAEMRVLGVFRPAGSPAAAFYPDGTPAYSE